MKPRLSRFRHRRHEYLVLSYPLTRPACLATPTAAEQDVAERIVEGQPTRQIARERGVSERTVTNQITQIYAKLVVPSRHELAALFAQAPNN